MIYSGTVISLHIVPTGSGVQYQLANTNDSNPTSGEKLENPVIIDIIFCFIVHIPNCIGLGLRSVNPNYMNSFLYRF